MSTAAVLLRPIPSTVGSNPHRSHRRRRRSPVNHLDNHHHHRRRRRPSAISPPVSKKNHLVMEEIKILKRGESLHIVNHNNNDDQLPMMSTPTLTRSSMMSTPTPTKSKSTTTMMMKGFGLDFDDCDDVRMKEMYYAGPAAFVNSPPPCCLPFPSALVRNGVATSDLRRILRI